MSQTNGSMMSRRKFLLGASMASVAAGMAMMEGCSAGATTMPSTGSVEWDEEFDVVVVGSGTAMMAALTAAHKGARTLLIEKASNLGGTTAFAAHFYLPGNPLGDDTREAGISYVTECAKRWGGDYDDATIASYVDNGIEMCSMCENELGMGFTLDVHAPIDYFNIDGAVTYGRGIGFEANGEQARMSAVQETFVDLLEELGASIRTGVEGKRLILDEQGAVLGIAMSESGREVLVRATKGVVLGTGGFDYNEDMVREFLNTPLYWSMAVPTNTGDGHLMGAAAGGRLVNMQSVWGGPSALVDAEAGTYEVDWGGSRGKPGSIIVNKYGKRFGNEASAYPIFNRAFEQWDTGTCEFRNIPGYLICDSSYVERYALPGANKEVGVIPEAAVSADSLSELAQLLSIDEANLLETVERFNEGARQGVDPEWSRGECVYDVCKFSGDPSRDDLANPSLAPLETPPFYALEMYPGSIGTNGGLKINENAQVLDAFDRPIPGLYAVGNTSSSVFGGAYPGGGATIGSGIIMSYAAAKHMMTQEE